MNKMLGYDYKAINGVVTLYTPKTQGVYTISVQRAIRALATLGLYSIINVVKRKSAACSKVLQLIDEGINYQDALRQVPDADENELNLYI